MEAVRGQKHPLEAKKGMKELIYQKTLSGFNQIWAMISDKKDTSQQPQLSPKTKAQSARNAPKKPAKQKFQKFWDH